MSIKKKLDLVRNFINKFGRDEILRLIDLDLERCLDDEISTNRGKINKRKYCLGLNRIEASTEDISNAVYELECLVRDGIVEFEFRRGCSKQEFSVKDPIFLLAISESYKNEAIELISKVSNAIMKESLSNASMKISDIVRHFNLSTRKLLLVCIYLDACDAVILSVSTDKAPFKESILVRDPSHEVFSTGFYCDCYSIR